MSPFGSFGNLFFFAVFTRRGLEKTPTFSVPSSENYIMNKPGKINWETVNESRRDILDSVMARMRETAKQRRVLAKPCFQDFDRLVALGSARIMIVISFLKTSFSCYFML